MRSAVRVLAVTAATAGALTAGMNTAAAFGDGTPVLLHNAATDQCLDAEKTHTPNVMRLKLSSCNPKSLSQRFHFTESTVHSHTTPGLCITQATAGLELRPCKRGAASQQCKPTELGVRRATDHIETPHSHRS
ncbi:ricin-type beta-trefoil lectin domain protein [Streptomyces sp. NPDC058464]|uniref:ricin-type beta-trefoil lectin domain protein n=1 Tax=Streptomyces sp. NPDC058464 TaxID=3346511 RepID=UPI00364A6DE6